MHAMGLPHTATMPLLSATAGTAGMWWWWSSDTSWVSHMSWGRYPWSVRFIADQVPFNLDNASSTTVEAPGQPAAVAAAQDTWEPLGMRPRVPPVLTMADCSSVLQRLVLSCLNRCGLVESGLVWSCLCV